MINPSHCNYQIALKCEGESRENVRDIIGIISEAVEMDQNQIYKMMSFD